MRGESTPYQVIIRSTMLKIRRIGQAPSMIGRATVRMLFDILPSQITKTKKRKVLAIMCRSNPDDHRFSKKMDGSITAEEIPLTSTSWGVHWQNERV